MAGPSFDAAKLVLRPVQPEKTSRQVFDAPQISAVPQSASLTQLSSLSSSVHVPLCGPAQTPEPERSTDSQTE